jgi:hypothetical protein
LGTTTGNKSTGRIKQLLVIKSTGNKKLGTTTGNKSTGRIKQLLVQ